jgi:hypothetical protein
MKAAMASWIGLLFLVHVVASGQAHAQGIPPEPVDPPPPPPLPQVAEFVLVDPPAAGPVGIPLTPVVPPRPDPPQVPVEMIRSEKDREEPARLTGVNGDPVALPDVYTAPEGSPLVISAPGHLANDFDPDGDTISWLSYTLPAGGTMSGTVSDGSFTYTPNAGFSGLDQLSYAISDGNGGIAFGQLLILVLDDQNRPPAAMPDVYTTPEGTPLVISAPGHLANDTDADGDSIEWLSYTLPAGGVMTGTTSAGSFTYTPNPGFSGLEEISYAIGDGNGGIDFGELLIQVLDDQNRPPITTSDVFTTPQDTALVVSAPGQLANDTDADGDPLTWLSYTPPANGVMTGLVADGTFTYTPDAGFSGLEEITYTVTDGNGAFASATMFIEVLPGPGGTQPLAVPDVFTTPEGTPLVVTAPGQLGNDTDLNGDPITWISYTLPAGGTMSGTIDDGSFTYTPNPGFSGVDDITYTVTDGNGGIASTTMQILVVDNQNRAPVAVPDALSTQESTPLAVSAPGHLANDFDLDGDPVEWLSYTLPSNGSVTGTTSDGNFTYTPSPGFSGLEEISYAIGDGNGGIDFGELLIKILDDQNRAPVAVPDVFTTAVDSPLIVSAPGQLANDFDLDGDPISWISYTLPSNGAVSGTMSDGSFVFTPDPGFTGLEQFGYAITDSNGGIAFGELLIWVGPTGTPGGPGGPGGPTSPPLPVPILGPFGLVLLSLLLGVGAARSRRRSRKGVT